MNLQEIRPNLYPTELLRECDSGLCLFGAGFYGANDAVHMYKANTQYVQVVDIDAEKMKVMEAMYPDDWVFTTDDVTTWVPNTANSRVLSWDIVSVDAPLNMFPWVLSNLNTIAKLSNKYLVVTMSTELVAGVSHYIDNPNWQLVRTMNRSRSGLIELMVFSCLP